MPRLGKSRRPGGSDSDNEITRVAAVSGLKSDHNQLTDLLWRVHSTAERPAPNPEMAKLLQHLGREALNRQTAAVQPPVPTTVEQMLRSFLDGQRQRQPSRQRFSPEGLVGRDVLLLWEDGTCSDTLSRL